MSEKLTEGLLPTNMRALLRPKLNVWLLLPWACRIMNSSTAPKKISGRKLINRPNRPPRPLAPLTATCTSDASGSMPASCSISTIDAPSSFREVKFSPDVVKMSRLLPLTSILSTSPLAVMMMTSLMGICWEPPSGFENSVKKMASTATTISRYIMPFRINREFMPPPKISRLPGDDVGTKGVKS